MLSVHNCGTMRTGMMGMWKWAQTWVEDGWSRAQTACSVACTQCACIQCACIHAWNPSPQLKVIHHAALGTPSLMARSAMICTHPCGSYPAARGPVNCSRACALGQGNARRAQHSSDLHITQHSKSTERNHASMVRQATKRARARTSWRSWRR